MSWVDDLPELTFVDVDVEKIDLGVVATVEKFLGRKLERADPLRIYLRGIEDVIIQQRKLIDEIAKMNLLAYAKGICLERFGDAFGVTRLPASSAITTAEVTLSTTREVATTIKKGTRVTADDTIFFALEDDLIFLAGETVKRAKAICTETGEFGNGYAAGELCKIVDPQPFLLSIVNVTTSEGGADVESDDALRDRIHEAPESFSCAGSKGSYEFLTKSTNQLIVDACAIRPADGVVNVYPLMAGGEIPEEEILELVAKKLDERTVRPLTDKVFVLPPEIVSYDFDVSYWIARSNALQAASIEEAAEKSVDDYLEWQSEKLGRDLNPSEIIYRLKKIGAKRVEVRSPNFTVLENIQVAVPTENITLKFEGLEDD